MRKKKCNPVLSHSITVHEDTIKELTLMLLGLTSFKIKGLNDRASYKGYSFRIIDKLREENLVHGPFGSNVIYMTHTGTIKVEELRQKYGIDNL